MRVLQLGKFYYPYMWVVSKTTFIFSATSSSGAVALEVVVSRIHTARPAWTT